MGVNLGGTRREVVALFSDIKRFTSFSESVAPENVVILLNTYLRVQVKVVVAYGGVIDKYVGDQLVAIFTDEADSLDRAVRRAVDCALHMQWMLTKLRATGRVPPIGVGIGINCGEVVLGAMGTEDRMDFTMIGDTVNVAARLCDAAHTGASTTVQSHHRPARSATERTNRRSRTDATQRQKPAVASLHARRQ